MGMPGLMCLLSPVSGEQGNYGMGVALCCFAWLPMAPALTLPAPRTTTTWPTGCEPKRRGPAGRPAVGRPQRPHQRVVRQPARRQLCVWPRRCTAVAAQAGGPQASRVGLSTACCCRCSQAGCCLYAGFTYRSEGQPDKERPRPACPPRPLLEHQPPTTAPHPLPRGCEPLCGRTWCSRPALRCWATMKS